MLGVNALEYSRSKWTSMALGENTKHLHAGHSKRRVVVLFVRIALFFERDGSHVLPQRRKNCATLAARFGKNTKLLRLYTRVRGRWIGSASPAAWQLHAFNPRNHRTLCYMY
jgi:hypothetical protein